MKLYDQGYDTLFLFSKNIDPTTNLKISSTVFSEDQRKIHSSSFNNIYKSLLNHFLCFELKNP